MLAAPYRKAPNWSDSSKRPRRRIMLINYSKEPEGKEVILNIAKNPILLLDIFCGPTRLVRVWVYPSALERLL